MSMTMHRSLMEGLENMSEEEQLRIAMEESLRLQQGMDSFGSPGIAEIARRFGSPGLGGSGGRCDSSERFERLESPPLRHLQSSPEGRGMTRSPEVNLEEWRTMTAQEKKMLLAINTEEEPCPVPSSSVYRDREQTLISPTPTKHPIDNTSLEDVHNIDSEDEKFAENLEKAKQLSVNDTKHNSEKYFEENLRKVLEQSKHETKLNDIEKQRIILNNLKDCSKLSPSDQIEKAMRESMANLMNSPDIHIPPIIPSPHPANSGARSKITTSSKSSSFPKSIQAQQEAVYNSIRSTSCSSSSVSPESEDRRSPKMPGCPTRPVLPQDLPEEDAQLAWALQESSGHTHTSVKAKEEEPDILSVLTLEEQMEMALRLSVKEGGPTSDITPRQTMLLSAIPRLQQVVEPVPGSPRLVVFDGMNVGMAHGVHRFFSVKGLGLAYEYFRLRGNKVAIFLPRKKWTYASEEDKRLLDSLEQQKVLFYVQNQAYDDRFIVKYADQEKGIILSNDRYRDILEECPEYWEQIQTRTLQFTWAHDTLMIADDPFGREGPSLRKLLVH